MDEALDLAQSSTDDKAAGLRLKIETLKWAAGKLNPKVYGKHKAETPNAIEGNINMGEDHWGDPRDAWLRRWSR